MLEGICISGRNTRQADDGQSEVMLSGLQVMKTQWGGAVGLQVMKTGWGDAVGLQVMKTGWGDAVGLQVMKTVGWTSCLGLSSDSAAADETAQGPGPELSPGMRRLLILC